MVAATVFRNIKKISNENCNLQRERLYTEAILVFPEEFSRFEYTRTNIHSPFFILHSPFFPSIPHSVGGGAVSTIASPVVG